MEFDREHLGDLIAGARAAYARLDTSLSELTDSQVPEPSLLPGWTRGHVLTHLARNADSHVRLLEAAANGHVVDQYAGGAEGRAADIETGAGRDAAALIDDVAMSSNRLVDSWLALPDDVWDRSVNSNLGMRPAWQLVWSRWREIDIHHVDLDLGYRPSHWPVEFTVLMFENVTQHLEARLPADTAVEISAMDHSLAWSGGGQSPSRPITIRGAGHSLVAWLLGRDTVADDLEALDVEGERADLPPLGPWA